MFGIIRRDPERGRDGASSSDDNSDIRPENPDRKDTTLRSADGGPVLSHG